MAGICTQVLSPKGISTTNHALSKKALILLLETPRSPRTSERDG
jgi:hypothetical protein